MFHPVNIHAYVSSGKYTSVSLGKYSRISFLGLIFTFHQNDIRAFHNVNTSGRNDLCVYLIGLNLLENSTDSGENILSLFEFKTFSLI